MRRDHQVEQSEGPTARAGNLEARRLSWLLMRSLGRLLPLGVVLGTACAHPATPTTPPSAPAVWIDAPLLGAPAEEAEQLAALAVGDLSARRVRLDRLIDLYDAARFGQDEDARETLWSALGGHHTGVGEQASRDAIHRLLQEALALEDDARPKGDEATVEFAGDAIMMLSTDLAAPASAEELSIQTLVYRTLVEQGHPRLQDNARWRVYDHVRGTLAGAVQVGPEHRLEVAVQALYARQDSVEELLADTAPHARPAWPTVEQLWAPLSEQQEGLAAEARWADVVDKREGEDQALRDTLSQTLPAPRSEKWPLRSVTAGTGHAESLGPVVRILGEQLVIDAGRGHAKTVALDGDIQALSQTLSNVLAQDGRGTLLLVAEPTVPAPSLRTALRVITRARAERIELAVREPRVSPGVGEVVTALPLYVTHSSSHRTGDRAWSSARLHVHLDGRGPMIAVDGRWLSERPGSDRELREVVESLTRAYPKERGIVVSLGADVQLQQLLDLLVALHGGPSRPFAAVGWMSDGARPKDGGKGDVRLARREALSWKDPVVALQQPYPLKDDDQKRLEAFAESLAVCLPELETSKVPSEVELSLRFEEARLRETEIVGAKRLRPAKGGVDAAVECIEHEGYAFRLRNHREGIAVTVKIRPAKG